ncbi:MAG: hypothetical protein ACI3Z7_01845 [Candidatus Aphodosoma sp.]
MYSGQSGIVVTIKNGATGREIRCLFTVLAIAVRVHGLAHGIVGFIVVKQIGNFPYNPVVIRLEKPDCPG